MYDTRKSNSTVRISCSNDRAAIFRGARRLGLLFTFMISSASHVVAAKPAVEGAAVSYGIERQLTTAPHGHILTDIGAWSPDGKWIVYDVRSDPAGSVFDGTTIEQVHVETSETRVAFESKNGACVGVATTNPIDGRLIFIHGPEFPTADWAYSAFHRRGVIADPTQPDVAKTLDARDITPPFTPGALRGGTHVHTFSGDGEWVSFTYEDHVLATRDAAKNDATGDHAVEANQRSVGVSVPGHPVRVPKNHPRNHDGDFFTVLVARTWDHPTPGSDEINRAFSDSWIGRDGYLRPDGTRQKRAIAFQGAVVAGDGTTHSEVFVVDLPDDAAAMRATSSAGPLEGTATTRPSPPKAVRQRRLTFTEDRKHPGLQGPRHWLRSSPDGSHIAFLMRDDSGISQLWTISPNGGEPTQVTHNPWDIGSAFSWSADGRRIAHTMDNSIFVTDVATGESVRVTHRQDDDAAPRPEACVFSPDGRKIAYVRRVRTGDRAFNQVFVVELDSPGASDASR